VADTKTTSGDDKYNVTEISNDPADYITGPRKGQANRTHGGTTQDGTVQVLTVEEPDDNPGQTGGTGSTEGKRAPSQ
jgi:hypothetical protein